MLTIKNLSFTYPHKREPVLSGINLGIRPGGIYGLLGSNGVGKSTLLGLIAGLYTPRTGCVELNGVNTRLRLPSTLADIFIVPEEFSLPEVTLRKYIDSVSGFYPRFSEADMRRYLEMFGMPEDVHLGRLSMGQRKKVYMSFALAANTPLLLMDEPTNGLDIPGKSTFKSFVASGMTDERAIIISTHQVQDINLLLDHVIIMENQGVLLNAPIAEITARLAFETTTDPSRREDALFMVPSLQGDNIVYLNTDGRETAVNLETLFSFVVSRPDMTASMFGNANVINQDTQKNSIS